MDPNEAPKRRYGNGLLFFRPGTPAWFRRRRWIFVAIGAAAGAALIWPVYPRFAGPSPRIFGLPLFFAWVVLALLIMFAALVWLYRGDRTRDDG